MSKKADKKDTASEELNSALWTKMSLSQLYKQRDLITTKISNTSTMLGTVPAAQPIHEFLTKGLTVLNQLIALKEKDRQ